MQGGQAHTTLDVLRVPDVRRIELGWGASVIGELAGQVTLVVYAFGAGGAVLVAAYVASRTLASVAVTLGIAGVAGRARPGVLLRRAMPPPGREVELLRRLAMFASLPLAVIELLAGELVPREFPAGGVAIREGDAGDLFYLVVEGSAAVSVHGEPRPPLGPGDCFGEIALLHDIPRTATVVAGQPLRTLALDREAFLVAMTASTMSRAAADALASQRLGADPPRGS